MRVTALAFAGLLPALVSPAIASPELCALEDPVTAERAAPVPAKPGESFAADFSTRPAVRRVRSGPVAASLGHGQHGGALAGKTIYFSPGHGWYYNQSLGWRLQRGNTHDIVEDLVSSETAAFYMIDLLRNMGAHVIPVRETDPNPNLAITDDGGENFAVEGELSLEAGPEGYGVPTFPITGALNPFRAGQSSVFASSAAPTGAAVWTFDVPESGAYNVYVGYSQAADRAPDAHYVVRHAGGETHFRVDQRRHGGTWVLLGRFFFERGLSAERGALVLHNDSATGGATLSADVARIGGGKALIDRGGGSAEFPMFEVCARYYLQLAGVPEEVYSYTETDGSNDVGSRSRFTAWDRPDGEDAIYLAWHTNAPSPIRGTSSFVYGPNSYGPPSQFTGVGGSLELMDAVHGELMADLRAVWEPNWNDVGKHAAYFGEVNPNHNPETPAVLVEVAFHDTAEDANALREPRFRYLAARAMAQGVARYFAERDGEALFLPPEPPTAPRAIATDDGLRISWQPGEQDAASGDAPDGYRVYLSRDGYSFDDGHQASGTEMTLPIAEVGAAPVFARVTAINAGGESFPSAVVAGRPGPEGGSQILVIGGFRALDSSLAPVSDYSAHGLGVVDRGMVDRMNDHSYLAPWGRAIGDNEISFSSATDLAGLDLEDFRAVFWVAGNEGLQGDAIGAEDIAALAAFTDGGGKLFVSGSHFASSLDVGSEDARAFLSATLRIAVTGDSVGSTDIAAGDALFAEVEAFSFGYDGPRGYDASGADILAAGEGAVAVLSYDGGAGGVAGVWWSDEKSGSAALSLGFPLEVIESADTRAQIVAAVVEAMGLEKDPVEEGEEEEDDPEVDEGIDLTGGCGCRAGGDPPLAPLGLALMVLVALVRRRR